MSRDFNDATAYLTSATTIVTAPPFTMAIWIKPTALVNNIVCGIGVPGSADNYYYLSVGSTNRIAANERDTVFSGAQTPANFVLPIGSWSHICGVFTSHSSRTIYVNGVSRSSDGTARTAATSTGIEIGGDFVSGGNLTAVCAHFAIWDFAMSAPNIASLLYLYPNQVNIGDLATYYPMVNNDSPEKDWGYGSNPLTVTGTTFSTDNPNIAGSMLGKLTLMGQAA